MPKQKKKMDEEIEDTERYLASDEVAKKQEFHHEHQVLILELTVKKNHQMLQDCYLTIAKLRNDIVGREMLEINNKIKTLKDRTKEFDMNLRSKYRIPDDHSWGHDPDTGHIMHTPKATKE